MPVKRANRTDTNDLRVLNIDDFTISFDHNFHKFYYKYSSFFPTSQ